MVGGLFYYYFNSRWLQKIHYDSVATKIWGFRIRIRNNWLASICELAVILWHSHFLKLGSKLNPTVVDLKVNYEYENRNTLLKINNFLWSKKKNSSLFAHFMGNFRIVTNFCIKQSTHLYIVHISYPSWSEGRLIQLNLRIVQIYHPMLLNCLLYCSCHGNTL